ncbi:MAG: DoxX family protein [Tepidiformaceae bacterium]
MTIRSATATSARTATGSSVARAYRAASNSSRTLWATQAILAAIFLFAGVMKLVSPADTLADQSSLPVLFLRLIGLCETLGAIGLIIPGLLRIRTGLTPLAAAGLVVIMVGAVTVTVIEVGVAPAIVPFAVGLASAFVALARSQAHGRR